MRCKRCGEDLPESEFRPLRKQRKGICRACEHLDAYHSELRGRERRLAEPRWGATLHLTAGGR